MPRDNEEVIAGPGGSASSVQDQNRSHGNVVTARSRSLSQSLKAINLKLDADCYERSDLLEDKKSLQEQFRNYVKAFEVMEEAEGSNDGLRRDDDDLRSEYTRVEIRINLVMKGLSATPDLSTPRREVGSFSLHKVEIPQFDGTEESWPLFWKRVEATIDNVPNSSDHDKIMFLRKHCNAEVQSMIDSRQTMGGTFKEIVDALKTRYDDPEALMENLVLKFLDLKPVPYTQQGMVDLRTSYERTIGLALNHRTKEELFEYLIKSVLIHKLLPKEFGTHLNQALRKKHFTLDEVRAEMENGIKFISFTNSEKDKAKTKQSVPHRTTGGTSFKPENDRGRLTIAQNRTYRTCLFCEDTSHETRWCPKFNTVSKRKGQLDKQSRCTICASKYHSTSKCDRADTVKCSVCGGKHHSVFCLRKTSESEPAMPKTVRFCAVNNSIALRSVALPTATGEILGPKMTMETRIFFDLGAQTSIITQTLAEKLNLQATGCAHMALSGLFVSKQAKKYGLAKFQVRLGDVDKDIVAVILDMPAFTINVPGLLDAVKIVENQGMQLADKEIKSNQLSGVHLSLGGDYFHDVVDLHKKVNGINVCRTPAGWMISGAIPDPSSEIGSLSRIEDFGMYTLTLEMAGKSSSIQCPDRVEIKDMDLPVHKLWTLDVVGISELESSPVDVAAHSYFLSTVRYENGQYWVRLPWRSDAPPLPSHFGLAMARLRNQRRWLQNQNLLQVYHDLILEMMDADFIEKVSDYKSQESVHYLPHSSVTKDSVTTPIRIVFDASARLGQGPSLNDCLLTGPTLTGHIVETILRFRVGKYAYSADISKAFLRIGLQPEDRDYTRFLWFQDPFNAKPDVVAYRFKSVLFGACCSPFLLQATIDYHLQKSDDPLAEVLRKSFYVDNLQGGSDNGQTLCALYESANRLLQQANMPLRMWVSNNPELIERIRKYDPDYIPPEATTLLGQRWDVSQDLLGFKSPVWIDGPLTKKTLLSRLHAVFDPLGILSPITIRGKILLKEAWATKLGWDEPLPESLAKQWSVLSGDLKKVEEIWVPRMVFAEESPKHLHVFCDASTKAYGAACYGLSEMGARIVLAKARPAPCKRTLPELEILAVEIGVKLVKFVEKALDKPMETIHIWTDSEIALQWIRNDKSNKVFVQNRVKSIRDGADNFKFLHVSSKSNPADLLSRGISGKDYLNNELWFNGPGWISDENQWPAQKDWVISVHKTTVEVCETSIEVERFSSLRRLLTATRFLFQAITSWFALIKRPASVDWSSQDALVFLIKRDQQQAYEEVVEFLESKKGKPPLLVNQLGLYKDDAGLIRCRGRIQATNADIDPEPILLARRSDLTNLIIANNHEMMAHGGVEQTLASLKVRYFIPKARVTVKKVLHDCGVCQVFSAKPYRYPGPPPLPAERVSFQRPFQAVGIDYTGAITLAGDGKVSPKLYVCLFTCTATRAVHLEIVNNLSAASFLLTFRQFIGRRGCPGIIITDNATCFKATAEFLRNLQDSSDVHEFLSSREISWQFIPPRSPWFGGFYERLIGLLKNSLRRVLYKRVVSVDELRTILCEIELVINNRPLTYVSDSVDDPIPLSPSHLIYGRRLEPFPSLDYENTLLEPGHHKLQESYQRINQLLDHWVKVWGKDYLTSLREKHYGASAATQPEPPKEGDIVLVSGPGCRSQWPLGRVMKLVTDKEGIVRLVKVLVNGKVMPKTINKLVPLELNANAVGTELTEDDIIESHTTVGSENAVSADDVALQELDNGLGEGGDRKASKLGDGDNQDIVPSTNERPRRKAAVEAEAERQRLLNSHQL